MAENTAEYHVDGNMEALRKRIADGETPVLTAGEVKGLLQECEELRLENDRLARENSSTFRLYIRTDKALDGARAQLKEVGARADALVAKNKELRKELEMCERLPRQEAMWLADWLSQQELCPRSGQYWYWCNGNEDDPDPEKCIRCWLSAADESLRKEAERKEKAQAEAREKREAEAKAKAEAQGKE